MLPLLLTIPIESVDKLVATIAIMLIVIRTTLPELKPITAATERSPSDGASNSNPPKTLLIRTDFAAIDRVWHHVLCGFAWYSFDVRLCSTTTVWTIDIVFILA